jgi:hypothetical protein
MTVCVIVTGPGIVAALFKMAVPSSNVSTTSLSGMGAPSNLSAAAAQGNPIIKVTKNTVMSFVILISFFSRLRWVPFCSFFGAPSDAHDGSHAREVEWPAEN